MEFTLSKRTKLKMRAGQAPQYARDGNAANSVVVEAMLYVVSTAVTAMNSRAKQSNSEEEHWAA